MARRVDIHDYREFNEWHSLSRSFGEVNFEALAFDYPA
jgi:hypothetical protein